MANPEHLKILKQGVEAWNRWREENPDVGAGPSSAGLKKLDLSEVEFDEADLQYANLSGLDLIGAYLNHANLRHANITNSDLSSACLNNADLRYADLSGTDLTGVELCEADLRGADLSNVNLREAFFRRADFTGANLRSVEFSKAADFAFVSFAQADLSGAYMEAAKLGGDGTESAGLAGAKLSRANLQAADFSGFEQAIILTGADLANSDFRTRVSLPSPDWEVQVSIDRVHLGSAIEMMRNETLVDVKWLRVHVGDVSDFDPEHDPYDSSYWLICEGDEGILQASYRRLAEQATDDITIEFTQSVWRELHLIEMGLREVLSDGRFTVQKADDRLAVTFESPESLQRGLEAIVVQVAAIESVEAERVKSMTIRPSKGEFIILEPAELELKDIASKLERLEAKVERQLPAAADLVDASVEHLLDKIPGINLFTPALAWLYRQGREHFELLRRRREQRTISGERRLLISAPTDAEDTSED